MLKYMKFFTKPEFVGLGRPEPMKSVVPEWYKKAELTYESNGEQMAGLKKCIPVLDAMISGYCLTLPFDLYISENKDGELDLKWSGPDAMQNWIAERPAELGATMPRPAGHHDNHLVWSGSWSISSPRGYSVLVTHPFNRFDLPFTTYTGLMDSDKFTAPGNIPFFIKKGFTGTVPKGTPIAQLLPVKRNKWRMIIDKALAHVEKVETSVIREPDTSYKKAMWQKKEYN